MPLLLLLLGLVFRERIGLGARAAIVIGIVMHAYAFFVINVLSFVS